MPALSLVVYYNAGLYADLAINIYYMFAAVYGWIAWQFYKKDDKPAEMPVSKMPRPFYVPAALITVALTATLSFVLAIFTDSTVPVWDSFTTALSVVAMWMLSRKYVEQWLVWVVVDIVSAGLYIYKGIYFYAALYALYAVVAIFGYINWKKMMHAND
jgi:nicotinamide mononucleotide transporter